MAVTSSQKLLFQFRARWQTPRPHPLVEKFVTRLAAWYDNPREWFPELDTLTGNLRLDGEPRQQRSERREAIFAYLVWLLAHTDFATWQSGRLVRSRTEATIDVVPYSLESIARFLGVGLMRLRRAEKDLRDAGLIWLRHRQPTRRHTPEGTEYNGLAATRRINFDALTLLGLAKDVVDVRAYALKKRLKDKQALAEKIQAREEAKQRAKATALKERKVAPATKGPQLVEDIGSRWFETNRGKFSKGDPP